MLKVILSTTRGGLRTIEGVAAVIDFGTQIARVASILRVGVARLNVGVSVMRRAAQRAGGRGDARGPRLPSHRACLPAGAHDAPNHGLDPIRSALELHSRRVGDLRVRWFEPPPPRLDAATLFSRGAARSTPRPSTDTAGDAQAPAAPALARLVVEPRRVAVGRAACVVAALIASADIRGASVLSDAARAATKAHGTRRLPRRTLRSFHSAARADFRAGTTAAPGIEAARCVARERAATLERALGGRGRNGGLCWRVERRAGVGVADFKLAGYPIGWRGGARRRRGGSD